MASSSTNRQKTPKGKGKGEPNNDEVPMIHYKGGRAF